MAPFVRDSEPVLGPEMGSYEQSTEDNDGLEVVPAKRKRCPAKKSTKRRINKKKISTTRKKSANDKHEDTRKSIGNTIKSQTGYHDSSLLQEPQDVIIKTEQDKPAHSPVDLPCPPTLHDYTDEELSSAFEHCGVGFEKLWSRLLPNLKFTDPASIFGKVYTILTENKKSSLYERQYLHRIWLQKYKPNSLKKFSEEEIGTAFFLCYKNNSKLNYNFPNSLFAKVYTFLTENKQSNCIERKYLYDVWTIKYKDTLCNSDPKWSKTSKVQRRKIKRRSENKLRAQQKRDLLLQQQQAVITQPEKLDSCPSDVQTKTTFQTDKNSEHSDMPVPPIFSLIATKPAKKKIRIRLKVEFESDDDYEANNAENCDDLSVVVNDTSCKVALALPLSQLSEPGDPEPQAQQKANADPNPKLMLKPIIRLTRLNASKLQQKEEGSQEIKGQKTSLDRKCRKSVISEKYGDNSSEDEFCMNDDGNDDYVASDFDHNSSDSHDDNSDSKLKTSSPTKNETTISGLSAGAKNAIKRARGRPRVHPIRIKKPRIKNTFFQKLLKVRLWGLWKHHKAPNQIPIPVHIWQASHEKHTDFFGSNTCEVASEDLEKTAPTVGKGTFANPHWVWTCSDERKNDRVLPLKCVCPACGLTFLEIDELLQHRDENHREYSPMCVICSRPMGTYDNVPPHLATHYNKDELEELYEKEMTALGAPPESSMYRMFKCQICRIIFVGTKAFKGHMDVVHLKTKKKSKGRNFHLKPLSNVLSEDECKVCGMPLSPEFMSFHLRTHLNLEEQKEYLREQQRKTKNTKNVIAETSIPGNDTTDTRIVQLKKILEALQRRNGKEVTKWPKPIVIKEAPVLKMEKPKVQIKRDGNYGPVQCATCGKVLATVYSLRDHETARHEGEKNFECSICHRPFSLKSVVANHIPTHFSLEEQVKFSIWKGNLWEFLERLNNGGNLNEPPKSTRGRKMMRAQRRIKKKPGRPRKHHHLYEEKSVYQIQGGGGGGEGQGQSQPTFSEIAVTHVDSSILLEGRVVGASTSTSTSSSTAEVHCNTWNVAYEQGQQGHDELGYFE